MVSQIQPPDKRIFIPLAPLLMTLPYGQRHNIILADVADKVWHWLTLVLSFLSYHLEAWYCRHQPLRHFSPIVSHSLLCLRLYILCTWHFVCVGKYSLIWWLTLANHNTTSTYLKIEPNLNHKEFCSEGGFEFYCSWNGCRLLFSKGGWQCYCYCNRKEAYIK
jgi:hypothetical protein